MAVSRRTRFEVLRRDGHTCQYCGAKAPDVPLTVDHVVPEALGGSDDPSNLFTACQPCNAGKASIAPDQAMVEDVDATAMLFSKAMAKALEVRAEERMVYAHICGLFDQEWSSWGEIWRQEDWKQSIERFLKAGLTWPMISDNLDKAMRAHHVKTNGVWKYFCGICWNEISDITATALNLLEDGQV